jgi:hypothetical protein
MRRAFVGFSTPIGYDYVRQAARAPNDQNSSPNPIIYGATGLLTLYDEIWFACESLCPAGMRRLPYVKFLDEHAQGTDLVSDEMEQSVEDVLQFSPFCDTGGLDDIFGQNYSDGMLKYAGRRDGVDNHTHGLNFLGITASGNVGDRQLATDLWLLDKFDELRLDLVLNPLTARSAIGIGGDSLRSEVVKLGRLELTEKVVSVRSLYDIVGDSGPYHPSLEEIREDDLIVEFREWMDEQTTRLDNQQALEIAIQVDQRVKDITRSSIRKYVETDNLENVAIDLLKDGVLELVPFATPIHRTLEKFHRNARVKPLRWGAFVALARQVIDELDRDRPRTGH